MSTKSNSRDPARPARPQAAGARGRTEQSPPDVAPPPTVAAATAGAPGGETASATESVAHDDAAHRQLHDVFWRRIFARVCELPDEFGLSDYGALESISTGPMPDPDGRGFIEPDGVFFCARHAQERWSEVRKTIGQNASFTVANIEFKKDQRPNEDRWQLLCYQYGLRFSFGQDIHIEIRQFVTGSRRPTHPTLRISGPNNQVPGVDAPCIYIGDLDADRVPAAFYENPYGAVATLTFPNGTTLAHVLHAARLWPEMALDSSAGTADGLFGLAAQIRPELCTLYREAAAILHEEGTKMLSEDDHARSFRRSYEGLQGAELDQAVLEDGAIYAAELFLAGVPEDAIVKVPKVHRKLQSVRKESRAAGRKRGLEQGLERGLERGREEGLEQGREIQYVDDLLAILRQKSIRLSDTQVEALRKLVNGKRPPIEVALNARSASDFARKVGLPRARRKARPAKKTKS